MRITDSDVIKVLHSHPIWLAQTQTWMYYLIQSLPETVRSDISCVRTQNLDQFAAARIHCFAQDSAAKFHLNRVAGRLRLPWRFDVTKQHLKHACPDIVHSHFGTVGAANYRTLRSASVPHVVTFYGADVDLLPKEHPNIAAEYREMFHSVSAVLCEGSQMARNVEALGCDPTKIIVQHLGVDLNQFAFRPRCWSPGETLRVLIAATFREKKGIPFALEGLANLASDVPLVITVIGDASQEARSQREKARIRETIDRRGIGPLVRWEGFQTHKRMIELAYQHHLFVSTSVVAEDGDSEGGAPVSLIEMAATGMPVVSSWHRDIPEVIVDGKTGWLAEERDIGSITKCLREAVENYRGWNTICRAGRAHVERDYNIDLQGARLAEIYRRVLEGRDFDMPVVPAGLPLSAEA